MNANRETIYLHVWAGDAARARALVERELPQCSVVELSHPQLRGGGWQGQLRSLHSLRGRALVVFFKSLNDAPQLNLVLWSGLVHRCRETIVSDESGEFRVYRRSDWLGLFPRLIASLAMDAAVLLPARLLLHWWKITARPVPFADNAGPVDVAYLFPYPLVRDTAGGAVSHIRGVLGGIAANGASCEVFSGAPLPVKNFPLHEIVPKRMFYLFWESMMLSYGIRFARQVRRKLGKSRPRMVYQRHGRFTVAGAIVSKLLKAPLVLEYNGSELWMASYWDPTRFSAWVRLCEEVALRCAALVVVVSDPIRNELLERGIPAGRILVNPNAVDPEQFHPGCGGVQLRREMGIAPDEIVIGFVGTFGPWHGIPILEGAMRFLLGIASDVKLRFLLVGDGSLLPEMRKSLQDFERSGQVFFPGIVSHDRVRVYLDASDILVSPHVPLPDGRPFFGSPTKLFEYMAMGKAIVASRLDQLAQVLSHNETALLVEPGSIQGLVDAIGLLVKDGALRERLGAQARQTAIARHTWKQNVMHVLDRVREIPNPSVPAPAAAEKQLAHSGLQ